VTARVTRDFRRLPASNDIPDNIIIKHVKKAC
jgi:hypothetical protein